jgi:hypothetical protein
MGVLKLYLLSGLLLVGVGVVWIDRPVSEIAVPAGILAIALGLMQVYVTLVNPAKLALATAYLAGIGGLILGGRVGELGGSILVVLSLAGNALGVLRFPGKSRTN